MADNNFDLKGFLNDPKVQADKVGAIKYLQSKGIIDAQGNPTAKVQQNVVHRSVYDKLLNNPVTNAIQNIFPGKEIGKAVGNSVYGLAHPSEMSAINAENNANLPRVLGDTGQAILTAGAPMVGNGATVGGRILANTVLGVGLGGTNAIAQGQGTGDVAKSAALGGAIGGGASALGEGLIALTKNLPKWLTKVALPKLDLKNAPYALENTKIGSLGSLQSHSNASMNSYENSIQSILSHPEFKTVAENSQAILDQSLSKFPNSNYTTQDLISNANNIAPKVGKLLQKFEAGQADIQEINTIRKELDAATKSVYTSLNRPPEAKLLGATLANSMRDYVQTNAPETQSIFAKYTQEIGLNKALQTAIKKGEQKVRLGDIGAGIAGFAKGGLWGALEAILAERLILNPAAQLAGAKILQTGAKGIVPVAQTAFQGLKAPIIKKVTQ